MSDTEQPGIILEPRKIFDKALLGFTSEGWSVYDYDKLIPACRKAHGISRADAEDWVDYNIYSYEGNGLRVLMKETMLETVSRGNRLKVPKTRRKQS
jgi:hypothetical protein